MSRTTAGPVAVGTGRASSRVTGGRAPLGIDRPSHAVALPRARLITRNVNAGVATSSRLADPAEPTRARPVKRPVGASDARRGRRLRFLRSLLDDLGRLFVDGDRLDLFGLGHLVLNGGRILRGHEGQDAGGAG